MFLSPFSPSRGLWPGNLASLALRPGWTHPALCWRSPAGAIIQSRRHCCPPWGKTPCHDSRRKRPLLRYRLRCHCNDPSLDDPIPQEYALFLCPTGPLLDKLQEFWRESKRQCAKNRAHEVFPHITLCDFFTVSLPNTPLVLINTVAEVISCNN